MHLEEFEYPIIENGDWGTRYIKYIKGFIIKEDSNIYFTNKEGCYEKIKTIHIK